MAKIFQRIENYFKNHTTYTAFVHILVGVGIGILLTHTAFDPHPLRWGLIFLLAGVLGHLYPLLNRK